MINPQRPAVLAALPLRAAEILNARRGARARRARRRVRRLRLHEMLFPLVICSREIAAGLGRRLGLVVGSSHARGRTRRASPAVGGATRRGCHAACADGGMTRTNHKPSLQSRSKQRVAVIAERAGVTRGSLTATEALIWDRIRRLRLGVVMRCQVPLLARFIADFYAPAKRLVIEFDGAYHDERARRRAARCSA